MPTQPNAQAQQQTASYAAYVAAQKVQQVKVATERDATIQLIGALQAVVNQATTDMANTALTAQQRTSARLAKTYARAAMIAFQALLAPAAPVTYTVTAPDTLFSIAQAQLGDARRYDEIRKLNGLHGLALANGQLLTMPPP